MELFFYILEMINNKPAKLILDNGEIFHGYSLGEIGTTIGEVCFNTGMTGYQEILTDPSYCGQLITMTYPHIGNYGTNDEDLESQKIHAHGFIVKDGSSLPSNFRSQQSLNSYLNENNLIGIQGIDTRKLVRCIRNEGAMNGIISSEELDNKKLEKLLLDYPSMEGLDLAKKVTCEEKYSITNNQNIFNVAVIDYGIKTNILNILKASNCNLTVYPASTSYDEIMSSNPDGVFLSNGPGDPAAVSYGIDVVKRFLDINIPIFGICLGHQILALALGAKTYKMKFGHRGCNHPVKNKENQIIEITSQNHGFAVDLQELPDNIIVTHMSLNDNSIEGISCVDQLAFSVQYHPESSPGPHDSKYLFKKFIDNIKLFKSNHAYAKTN